MLKINVSDLFEAGRDHPTAPLNSRRRASWLQSEYSDHEWLISDSFDHGRAERLNFRHRMADGRCLTEVPSLYATVKEYAWWVRDERYSRIDDAYTHVSLVRGLMNVAHGLSLRGIWSFSLIGPLEIASLVEECRYGADAVLQASDRLADYIKKLADEAGRGGKPFGGLPRTIGPDGCFQHTVSATELVARANLPDTAVKLPRVAWVIARAAVANGLRVRSATAEDIPELGNITAQALQRWLDPLESLWVMRHKLEADALTIRPFARGAAQVAAVKGFGTARTPIPPPKLALHLMEHATRWVVDYADPILEVLEEVRREGGWDLATCEVQKIVVSRLPASGPAGSPWPIAQLTRQHGDDLSFSRSIKFLATAAWIVIATFTARRYEELVELEDDALYGSDGDGWWLNTYIEKTLQRKEHIPVPNAVARAIEILKRLSCEARELSDSQALFQWLNPFTPHEGGVLHRLDPRGLLDAFAAHVGVPRPVGKNGALGEPWHWHPHQFRRFFAVLYFYRYEGASLEALAHMLRHFNLEMTRRYVTQDKDVAAIMNDVQWGFGTELARQIIAGERTVAGGMGRQLSKMAKRIRDVLRKTLNIVSPDRVSAAMTLVMQRKGIVLTPKPWTVCSCPRTKDAARIAQCRSRKQFDPSAIGPDFAEAGPAICPQCPFAIIDTKTSGVQKQIGHLVLVEQTGTRAGTLFGELERANLVTLNGLSEKGGM